MIDLHKIGALNSKNYDRVTTICLLLGVGAALAYKPDSELAWISYVIAGIASAIATTMYFYRRVFERSAMRWKPDVLVSSTFWINTLSPQTSDAAIKNTLLSGYLDALTESSKHDESFRKGVSEIELPFYGAFESRRVTKSIERSMIFPSFIDHLQKHDSTTADIQRSRQQLLAYFAAIAVLNQSLNRFPAISKTKTGIPKKRASEVLLWVNDPINEPLVEQKAVERTSSNPLVPCHASNVG